MIYKVPSHQPGFARVVFELPSCVWADRIYVTGSFNNWDNTRVPMLQDRDGVWRAIVEFAENRREPRQFALQLRGDLVALGHHV